MRQGENHPLQSETGFQVMERRRKPDGTLVLRLAGHLDIDGSPQLQAVLAAILQEGPRQVELDCAGVRFISSVGVGVLIVAVSEFRAVGGDIVIAGLNAELRHMFEMLNVTDYVTLR